MYPADVISLTRKLLSYNTVNPPGNEREIAEFTGEILLQHGFHVEYIPYGENRSHLVAEKGIISAIPPVVLSGHFDTVPQGMRTWNGDPFTGMIKDGKLYGRGSSDMKGALAAMVIGSICAFREGDPPGGVRLLFTADEETGCRGIQHLLKIPGTAGNAAAIVIGEPTGNNPCTGHKGGLYLNVTTTGKTAHSSMPEMGDNAIYKAAKAILKMENFRFNTEKDALLGFPTLNVGKMSGGMNLNSVPDHAEFTIDIRSTKKMKHPEILNRLKAELGEEAAIEILVDLEPVSTDEADPFVQMVYDVCKFAVRDPVFTRALPYLTEGSVLQPFFGGIPTVILGPGQPDMAHQTDEYCYLDRLTESVDIYKNILLKRSFNHD